MKPFLFVKNHLLKLKAYISTLKAKQKNYCNASYGGTSKVIYWFAAVLFSVLLSFLLSGNSGLPYWVDFIIFILIGLLVFLIAGLIIKLLLNILKKCPAKIIISFILLFVLFFFLFFAGTLGTTPAVKLFLLATCLVIFECLFAASITAVIRRRKSILIYSSLLITTIINVLVICFIVKDGSKELYMPKYLALNSGLQAKTSSIFSDSLKTGPFEVATVEYGTSSDNSLESTTYDLLPFAESSNVTRFVRKSYLGFDIDEVPLAGKIWYPVDSGTYPLVAIIHGNHILTEPSYLGYEYLGEHLASRGFVVVSVDENSCNGYLLSISNENDARAVLLLENIRQLKNYNEDPSCILYNKMDFENIAIAGHSRGGEAAAIAALFNDMDYYPDDGNIVFDYHYNIKGIIAIAPSIDQYMPIEKSVQLKDINYFLIQGANDQDVNIFMGIRQYENIEFTGDTDAFKSYLYIAGANHGQFNSIWGRYDLSGINKYFLNTEALIAQDEQQKILKGYMTAFLERILLDKEENITLFEDYKIALNELPKTVYIQGYEDSNFQCISNFEEDIDISTATMDNVKLSTLGMKVWTERNLKFSNSNRYTKGTYAVGLEWNDCLNACYTMDFSVDMPVDDEDYLQFSIMDMDNDSVKDGDYRNIDFSILIENQDGKIAKVVLSDYYTIYPPLPVEMYKLQTLLGNPDYKQYMQTVRIPLSAFQTVDGSYRLESIHMIMFLFDKQDNGNIAIDNIGIAKSN